MVVTQLVEQLLPTPEVRGLNPVNDNVYSTNISCGLFVEKTKIKKKIPGMAHLKR